MCNSNDVNKSTSKENKSATASAAHRAPRHPPQSRPLARRSFSRSHFVVESVTGSLVTSKQATFRYFKITSPEFCFLTMNESGQKFGRLAQGANGADCRWRCCSSSTELAVSPEAAGLEVVLLSNREENALRSLPVCVCVVQAGGVGRDLELSDDGAAGAVAVVERVLATRVQALVGVDVNQRHSGCKQDNGSHTSSAISTARPPKPAHPASSTDFTVPCMLSLTITCPLFCSAVALDAPIIAAVRSDTPVLAVAADLLTVRQRRCVQVAVQPALRRGVLLREKKGTCGSDRDASNECVGWVDSIDAFFSLHSSQACWPACAAHVCVRVG